MSVSTGEEDIGVGADVTGSSITTSITGVTIDALGLIGSGWGRDLWGSMAWGDAYSVQTGSVSAQTAITGVTTQANADVQAQGQSLTVVTGDEVPEANANVFPDGVTATTDIGEVQALRLQGIEISTGIGLIDIQAGGNVFLNVTEHTINTGIGLVEIEIAVEVFQEGIQLNTFIGDEEAFTDVIVSTAGNALSISEPQIVVDLNTPVDVTGSSLSTAIGDEEAFTDVTVEVTGTSMADALGDIVVDLNTPVDVTGSSLSTEVNSVTIKANSDVSVTGLGLTISTVTPNIIAWAEVDTGTPVNWTAVDLAA
jgi:hypothetical protein